MVTPFQQVTPALNRVIFPQVTLALVVTLALAPVCFRVAFPVECHKTKHPRVPHRAIARVECRERKLVVALVSHLVVVALVMVQVVVVVFPLVVAVVFLRVTESLLMCRTFRLLRKTPVIAMRKSWRKKCFGSMSPLRP
ncbi:hypothetical protein DO97_07950 [Neosynechococcus sphagnicola sy1]|uniref:Uncharacterized protein n=1 Tax=Neosynechococcus sphagnicola sy1 TaxID=1497020 RepID=A0A098TJM1_9CYAN|nr:hypothetical protein [Neosynechococcus sphagnicola]KGF72484.1 hypothetical protein DO97_07950 [Neosynechococcus sphagnicola sy1]